ncbi:hypothetical protein ACNY67_06685 [Pantoea sp. KXB45]|uniref:hypothetical protein n=1 Tax=Pantoea sp. KXB45 TaxID=3402309 RepID=UPI003AB174C1
MTVNLAMIADGDTEVLNTIVAENEVFKMSGFYFVPIADNPCQIGMFYNKKDGLFYFDKSFKLTSNPIEDPSQFPAEAEDSD